jgi:hypothetical protein
MKRTYLLLWLSCSLFCCRVPAPSHVVEAKPAAKPLAVEETPAAAPVATIPATQPIVVATTQPVIIAAQPPVIVGTTQPTSIASKPPNTAPIRIPKGKGKALPIRQMKTFYDVNENSPEISYSAHLDSTVVLSLFDNGKVTLTDEGSSDSLMASWEYVKFEESWENQWKGTWYEKGPETLMELTQVCEGIKELPKGGFVGCTTSSTLLLSCETKSITTNEGKSYDALVCETTGGTYTGGSSVPWVFGKKSCLQRVGQFPTFYREC